MKGYCPAWLGWLMWGLVAAGWKTALAASVVISLATAAIVWLVIRDDPGARFYSNAAYSSAFIWFLACAALR
jgi:hypothetical protein